MNKSVKAFALTAALLLAAHVLFGQSYVRPVSLPEGVASKKFSVVEYQDGSRIVVDAERNDHNGKTPTGEVKNTTYFLIVDGMWMETTKKGEGNMKLGEVVLPMDGVRFNGILVSDPQNRAELAGHEPLDASVTYRKTVFKYKDTLDLKPTLKDSVLRVENRLVLRCGKENDPNFKVIVNDTDLLPGDFKAGTDVELDLAQKPELADPKSIKKVAFVPDGHVPTVITKVRIESVDDRTTLAPDDPTIPWWYWVVLGGVLALLGAGVALWMSRRRKHAEEAKTHHHDHEHGEENKEDEEGQENEEGEGEIPMNRLISNARADERKKSEKEIVRLKDENNRLEEELKKKKEDFDKRVAEAREEINKKSEKDMNRLKDEKQGLEEKIKGLQDRLRDEKADAEKRVAAAREEERTKHEGTINTLTEQKKTLNDTLVKEREQAKEQIAEAHEEEKKIAEKAIKELKAAHQEEVDRLEDEQRVYTEKIAFVPFASQYARDVYSLIQTVNDINRQAKELTKADVEDPYLIYKAISKFNLVQSEIDFEGLLLDVALAAKDDMSFANSGIANLKTVSQDQMFSSLRSYFLSSYLEKYIDAAVVYNESLAGIDRLVEGIDESMTAPFKLYREKIKECCKRLGIAVISVKLFDTLGDNVDLKATMVDFDSSLPADSIIAIENCLVYPEGGRRPMEKIYVKAQK